MKTPAELPRTQEDAGWYAQREKLMGSAAGVALATQADYHAFVPRAMKAVEMARYQAERAHSNGGQFTMFA
jgi:hypothetical protein